MPICYVIEGPVGAGKSTYAARLAEETRTPPLILDQWLAGLFQADRPETDLWPWYRERKRRCIDQIWAVARGLLELDQDAIVELGLITVAERRAFLERVHGAGHRAQIRVLDAPRPERWRRVQGRNAAQGDTFAMVVPEAVFTMASDLWEPLTEAEMAAYDVVVATA